MKKIIFCLIAVYAIFSFTGCVESSKKYKTLKAQADSLSVASTNQNAEMETLLADLNEISAGMQSLREAENLLTLEAKKENVAGTKAKQQTEQLKADVRALSAAISMYKERISKLESQNRNRSAELNKMIASLKEELNEKQQTIDQLSAQLEAANKQIAEKTQQVNDLTQNVNNLTEESTGQKKTISEQDHALNQVYYLVGSRKDLKAANVITRQGIFCPPIVSSQAQRASFKACDARETKSIPLNSKKVKVLSTHPEGSYSLDADAAGMLTLNVKDVEAFWKQEKYLVVAN